MSSGTREDIDPVEQAIELLREAARAMRSPTTGPADEIRAWAAVRNAADARISDLLAEMDETKAHEREGASSIATWAAREVRIDPKTTRQFVRAAKTMRLMPEVGAAARRGDVGSEHLAALTYGLRHVGEAETIAVEEQLLTLAGTMTPRELFTVMRSCKAVAHAADLDEAWLRGMDKSDVSCLPVPDGYHLTGFLPIDVGAKLATFLKSVSVPRTADDMRTGAERRIDGLDDLLTRALGSGLPAEGRVRPHLSVVVDSADLQAACNRAHDTAPKRPLLDAEPAVLDGFGPIGPALLAYIAWGSDITPILVAGFRANRTVLDAGRSRRLATRKQAAIIGFRQRGRCANRGCHHPIGEIHHVVDWASGGPTDLDNLVGLCRKCHSLVTLGRLVLTGTWSTGYTFSTARAAPLARAG